MDIRADLGEEPPVEVGPSATLGVGEAPLADLAQEHLGEALVRLARGLVRTAGGGAPEVRLPGTGQMGGDASGQLRADGIGGPVEDH